MIKISRDVGSGTTNFTTIPDITMLSMKKSITDNVTKVHFLAKNKIS